ncbi:hypothetical protein B1207_07640 [Legionella quinlivanii]|uniref:Uncharacterized protein n=2 Tax=Legionella quinlivanii TaxID=45073 RepID=A0A364LJI6_9GAMM|nr:hypothetical protein B1207_07640 [Legionella quinlivanii]
MLDDNLEYRVLCKKSGVNSDSPWLLQEFDKNDRKDYRDFIPWDGFLTFKVNDLLYSYSTDINNTIINSEETDCNTELVRQGGSILGRLQPIGCYAEKSNSENEDFVYSMFGSKRPIEHFGLNIKKNKNSNDKAKCQLRGWMSFTEETGNAHISVYLSLTPQQFDSMADLIKSKHIDLLELTLHNPPGFYSERASSGENYIKILMDSKEHKFGQDSEINPPCLGYVNDFNIKIIQRHYWIEPDEEEQHEVEKEEVIETQQDLENLLPRFERIEAVLGFPLWVILVMFCILFFKFIFLQ